MTKLTWKQTIKLGKKEVVSRLQSKGIVFDIKQHYFKLCSLLYKAVDQVVTKVVSLADKKLEKAEKALENATDLIDYLGKAKEALHAKTQTLLF